MIAAKLFGGAILMTMGVVTAWLSIGRERQRLSVLDAWIDLISRIKGEIDLYLTPISEILMHSDPSVLSALNHQTEKPPTLQGLLSSSAPFLSEECKREIVSLIKELGSSYREEELRQCEHHLTVLNRARERLFAELPQKTKLYTMLSLCASAGILILLW